MHGLYFMCSAGPEGSIFISFPHCLHTPLTHTLLYLPSAAAAAACVTLDLYSHTLRLPPTSFCAVLIKNCRPILKQKFYN